MGTFSNTKADKQSIRHSLLLSKIKDSGASDTNRIRKTGHSTQKRRRPNKKLVASLASLADALPDLENSAAKSNINKTSRENPRGTIIEDGGTALPPSARNHSLKSKPGVMKKRAKLEAVERKIFGMNIAMMNTSDNNSGAGNAVETGEGGTAVASGFQDRWEALKRHVQGNMEKKPEFETP